MITRRNFLLGLTAGVSAAALTTGMRWPSLAADLEGNYIAVVHPSVEQDLREFGWVSVLEYDVQLDRSRVLKIAPEIGRYEGVCFLED